MSIIALFILLLISVSANTSVKSDVKVADDLKLPNMALVASDSLTVQLDSLRGDYTVVHFWSVTDAESRIKAIELDRLVAGTEGSLHLLSINTDDNARLPREIVRIDGMDEATQYYAGSAATSVALRENGLDHGSQTFLLAPDGTIVAVDPSNEALAQAAER